MIYRVADDIDLMVNINKLEEYLGKHRDDVTVRDRPLFDAYMDRYEIFMYPKKESYKPDNRIAVNFAKYLVDTFNGFFTGVPVRVTADNDRTAEFVSKNEAYNGLDDTVSELSKNCDIFGHAYEMYYVDEDGEIGVAELDPMESFMIHDESILQRPRYFVRTYVDTDNILHGSISNEHEVRWFIQDGALRWVDEPQPHGFDGVPATEYMENSERAGLYESCMSMINAYNKAISEKDNDVDYFSDSYLKILGAKLDSTELNQIRSNRIINFEGSDAGDLVVDFLQKPSADATQENLLDRLERLIFQISMIANISDENFAGTASGISLKYKLLAMSNLAKVKERKFTAAMNRRYRLMFSNPVSGMRADDWIGISYTFTQNMPTNLTDEAQAVNQLTGIVSKRTQLALISAVDDIDEEMREIAKEEDETSYQTDYPTERT